MDVPSTPASWTPLPTPSLPLWSPCLHVPPPAPHGKSGTSVHCGWSEHRPLQRRDPISSAIVKGQLSLGRGQGHRFPTCFPGNGCGISARSTSCEFSGAPWSRQGSGTVLGQECGPSWAPGPQGQSGRASSGGSSSGQPRPCSPLPARLWGSVCRGAQAGSGGPGVVGWQEAALPPHKPV